MQSISGVAATAALSNASESISDIFYEETNSDLTNFPKTQHLFFI
jgi:hypothetical protein